MKLIVGGGAGFIGGALSRELASLGMDVVAIDDLRSGVPPLLLQKRLSFEKADLSQPRVLKRFSDSKSPSVYIHVAGQSDPAISLEYPEKDLERTVIPVIRLTEAISDLPLESVILVSTGEVLSGDDPEPKDENSPVNPQNPYGATHLLAERYLQYRLGEQGIPFSIVRLPPVYGPGMRQASEGGFIAKAARFVLDGYPYWSMRLKNNGLKYRDYLYIDDAVSAISSILTQKIRGLIHVSGYEAGTEREIFTQLRLLSGRDVPLEYEGGSDSVALKRVLSTNRDTSEWDWMSEVSLSEGLLKTLDYFRGHSK
ncbi:MAG: NAD-dependent epimerase/dehydratase family protein [Leptospirillum sp.]